jgi:C-terminal processing protease CtpA/Prc
MRTHLLSVVALSLFLIAGTAFAGERGYFGFGLSVGTKGFFLNPDVQWLKIESVVPGTPAARAGIVPGDLVVKVDDLVVAGSKALTLKSRATHDVGQSVRLELKHANGSLYIANLVAIAKR